ncbi:MAG TPA: hypothetical protein VN372_07270 [Methanospirillum sp.]|nr:hypothetical protein [Methanospirillum sp.]
MEETSQESFLSDQKTIDAVTRRLENTGEAPSQINGELRIDIAQVIRDILES